jgi:hypothetical protein
VRPCLLLEKLSAQLHRDFLKVLLQILEDVPLAVRREVVVSARHGSNATIGTLSGSGCT